MFGARGSGWSAADPSNRLSIASGASEAKRWQVVGVGPHDKPNNALGTRPHHDYKHFTTRPGLPRVSAKVPTDSFVSVKRIVSVMLLPDTVPEKIAG